MAVAVIISDFIANESLDEVCDLIIDNGITVAFNDLISVLDVEAGSLT